MNTKEYITAEEAAEMLSMTVNAFRIFLHRYKKDLNITKVKLGERKTYYLRSSIVALLKPA